MRDPDVRPIPEDETRLQAGFHQLSPEARYQRFLATMSDLTDDQLRHLTEIDYRDHMAFVAIDPSRPELPAAGVARYTSTGAPSLRRYSRGAGRDGGVTPPSASARAVAR